MSNRCPQSPICFIASELIYSKSWWCSVYYCCPTSFNIFIISVLHTFKSDHSILEISGSGLNCKQSSLSYHYQWTHYFLGYEKNRKSCRRHSIKKIRLGREGLEKYSKTIMPVKIREARGWIWIIQYSSEKEWTTGSNEKDHSVKSSEIWLTE